MVREISSGGVVLRQISGVWHVALIEPQKESPRTPRRRTRAVLALPKGLVDSGETPQATAVREVLEETGIRAEPVTKLADIKYVYVRTWGNGERVFKIVSFYLLRYLSGEHANRGEASALGPSRRRCPPPGLQQRTQSSPTRRGPPRAHFANIEGACLRVFA